MTRLVHPWAKPLTVSGSLAVLALVTGLPLSSQAQTSPPASPPTTESPAPSEPSPADTTTPPEASASYFACQMHNGRPTVMYAPNNQPGQMYPWAVPQAMGSDWPAQRRCEVISERLESYRPDGLLTLATGTENGYSTVCVTTESVPGCRIVFTVPSGQDPVLTRDQVFANLASADQGQATEGVNTFVGSGSNGVIGQIGTILGLPSGSSNARASGASIDLRPFLAPADGGTGSRLTGRSATPGTPAGRPLNPDSFR